ncbi:chitinase [Emericellopsis atlantica]|uniref:Chitinase n=1 Tax=Emericellopsis atlantica TaxID=2614577 RepID=A0A9P7ZH68_9HYPO|nr:chitinase [Emericellopsis atlantica]KAG9251861.1 chitinase [Emericellopsis atlantica]
MSDPDIDIIPIAFLNGLAPPLVNFANAGDNCTTFPEGPSLLDCPQIEEDIKTCQAKGKTIVLSMGGATYSGGGFQSADAAVDAARTLWATFGPEQPGSNALRPFGSAVIDGFDYDFESATSNMVSFGQELRRLMEDATASGDKRFYITAAPQCPYPDQANGEALAGGVSFDFIMIQFYNNYCGVQSFVPGAAQQYNFNMETWDAWAASTSLNPDVKILLGIPANTGAGAGYTEGEALASVIQYSKQYASFGGVMMWDMSQLYANEGFLGEVVNALG